MAGGDDTRRTEDLPDTVPRFFRPTKSGGNNEIPCLAVLSGSRRGDVVVLPIGRSIIGRAPSALLSLDDDGVSRRHAALDATEQREITLVDLESTNGTYLNGAPIERAAIREGDRIQIGSEVSLRFSHRLRDELEAMARGRSLQAPPSPPPPPEHLPLSKRELEVACLAAEALSSEDIGRKLHISPTTVKTHLRNVYQRLELHSRLELAHYLMDHGVLRSGGDR